MSSWVPAVSTTVTTLHVFPTGYSVGCGWGVGSRTRLGWETQWVSVSVAQNSVDYYQKFQGPHHIHYWSRLCFGPEPVPSSVSRLGRVSNLPRRRPGPTRDDRSRPASTSLPYPGTPGPYPVLMGPLSVWVRVGPPSLKVR